MNDLQMRFEFPVTNLAPAAGAGYQFLGSSPLVVQAMVVAPVLS